MYKNAPPLLTRAVLDANPVAATAGPYPPLHVALHRISTPLSSAKGLSWFAMPDFVRDFLGTRTTMISVLLGLGLPLDVSRIILSFVAHPGTIRAENGRTVLHYACALPDADRSLRVAALLPPEAAHVLDNLGQSPIHIICGEAGWSPSSTLVRSLVRVNPAALSIRSKHSRQTPLHVACATLKPRNIIQILVDADSCALTMVNKNGFTPLQLFLSAFVHCGSADFFSVRDRRWKEGARTVKVLLNGAGVSTV
mmetsp:Transcript_9604/g.28799  ORF Transcript_9604/g.28799 Transcript_9604/m.28799 type:complete len:253 (-) Transcript_9604:180-938(-)